jgi:preprotein translocase SecE subunit
MADKHDDETETDEREPSEGSSPDEDDRELGETALARADDRGEKSDKDDAEEDDAPAAAQLGATRYVMAGFFITGVAAAFVVGKLLSAIWSKLAETNWAQTSATFLARVGEEERGEYTTVVGGIAAVIAAVYAYRRADVRLWTEEVSSELSKVTWPNKSEVTNNTIIVLVTGAFATAYFTLLDRFWGFVTNLVYGS